MCNKNVCWRLLETIVVILVSIVVFYFLVQSGIKISSKFEIGSIFIAILIFYAGWRIDYYSHYDNQIGLIISLKNELKVIEEHGSWYEQLVPENILPEHEIRKLNLGDYTLKIDSYIGGKSTIKLKKKLHRLYDKITLINNYSNWIMTLYLSEKIGKRNNKLIKVYLEKIKKTIPDLRNEIADAKDECSNIYC